MNYKLFSDDFETQSFYSSQISGYFLENFDNDVVLYGGMDPWETVKDSKFELLVDSTSSLAYFLPIGFLITNLF